MYDLIIVTMNSNEIDLNEWAVHHILLGVDHIYIYDDHSDPMISVIVSELPDEFKSKITIYRLDSHYEINQGTYTSKDTDKLLYFDQTIYDKHKTNKQRYLMNYFIKYHKHISKYCFFCDVDEYIYLKEDDSIMEYLHKMSEYDVIYIPWIYYGTSFYVDKPKGLLLDNFRCHSGRYDCGKSIVKMANVSEIHCIHSIADEYKKYSYDRNDPLYSHPIHINHYITKAYKSVLRKKKQHCLGQTNDFYRSIQIILCFGIGDVISKIKNEHIMEKYVSKINRVLNYELNDQFDFNYSERARIFVDNKPLNEIQPQDLALIEYILDSKNVEYKDVS